MPCLIYPPADLFRGGAVEPEEVARRIYDAYRIGDLAGIQAVVSPDVILHMPGDNVLAGDYVGVGGVMALVARAAAYFEPASVRLLGIDVGDDGIESHVEVSAGFMALQLGPIQLTHRMRFDPEGRVAETWIEPEDPVAWDRFVGRLFDRPD